MNLYLLKRAGQANWDEYRGFVIRAESEEHARKIAKGRDFAEDETGVWESAMCTLLSSTGEEGIILSDFNAG